MKKENNNYLSQYEKFVYVHGFDSINYIPVDFNLSKFFPIKETTLPILPTYIWESNKIDKKDTCSPISMVYCKYCSKWHYHGIGNGHRVAHCTNYNSEYYKTGYILETIGIILPPNVKILNKINISYKKKRLKDKTDEYDRTIYGDEWTTRDGEVRDLIYEYSQKICTNKKLNHFTRWLLVNYPPFKMFNDTGERIEDKYCDMSRTITLDIIDNEGWITTENTFSSFYGYLVKKNASDLTFICFKNAYELYLRKFKIKDESYETYIEGNFYDDEEYINMFQQKTVNTEIFTYFIQDSNNKCIKIGFSNNPMERCKSLQTANPNKLKIVGVINGNLENNFHKQFNHLKTEADNEWFKLDDVLINTIKNFCPTAKFCD